MGINMTRWQNFIVIWFVGIFTLLGIGFFSTSLLTRENTTSNIQSYFDQLNTSVDLQLSQKLNDLNVLAQNPLVTDLLMGQNSPDNPEILALLNGVKAITQADIIYVMNSDGTVLGCSLYGDHKTLTGNNYSFRPYFIKAKKGLTVVYPALGVTTNARGIYLSKPVKSPERAMLTKLGNEVVLAKDGTEAINLYTEAMNSDDPIMANFREHGFCAALVKPFQLQELSRVLSQVLG